jgi:hypothetical protein
MSSSEMKCSFGIHTLARLKGFFDKWHVSIQSFIPGGSVVIKVKGKYFQTKKRLREGYSLSSMLFNIVVDMLVVIIERVKSNGQIESMVLVLLMEDYPFFITRTIKYFFGRTSSHCKPAMQLYELVSEGVSTRSLKQTGLAR